MHPGGAFGTTTNHGFTGHEQLDETFLTHMNGRVYDYRLGRFLTVDPLIANPASSQSINPYSYGGNNPLSGVDPTGYAFFTGGGPGGGDHSDGRGLCGNESGPCDRGLGMGTGYGSNSKPNNGAHLLLNFTLSIIQGPQSIGSPTHVAQQLPDQDGSVATGIEDGQGGQTTPAPSSSSSTAAQHGGSPEAPPNVHLGLNIKFVDRSGNVIDNGDTRGLIAAAEVTWTGTFGEYRTIANFRDPGARVVTVLLDSSPAGGVSRTPSLEGAFEWRDNIILYTAAYNNGVSPAIPYTPLMLRDTFAHEVGHVLGSGEQFNSSGPFPGHGSDIMGVVGIGNKTVESTMREILSWRGAYP
jgi:RHS repeat-associated protein